MITRRGASFGGNAVGAAATVGEVGQVLGDERRGDDDGHADEARWAPTASPSAAAPAPRPAPHRPPTLKAPWKRGISGRSIGTSTSWAAAFIDTSHVP